MELLGKQIEIMKNIYHDLNRENHISQKSIYLFGEMGVGKTYISSKIATKFLEKPDAYCLIIAPDTVIKKWKTVLEGFGQSNIILDKIRKKDYQFDETMTTHIISHKDVNQFIKKVPESVLKKFNLTIVDEIHMFRPNNTSYKALAQIIQIDHQENHSILMLTGTIFNQNYENLAHLISITNPKLYMSNVPYDTSSPFSDFTFRFKNDLSSFFANVGRYISHSIALNDVKDAIKHDNDEDILQTIAPIHILQMDDEQKAFFNLFNNQQKTNGVSKNTADKNLMLALDRPESQKESIKIRRHGYESAYSYRIKQDAGIGNRVIATGLKLIPIAVKQTVKYQALLATLKNCHQDKVLIFAQDRKLIKDLTKNLTDDGIPATSLPVNVPKTEYSAYINQALETDYDVFIVDNKQISVGVDITKASIVVWYQMPTDVSTIIQSQRRVYRLSSTKSSIVHFFVYDQTPQLDTIKQVANAAKSNAATYNVREDNALTRISGILLGDLNSNEKDD